MPEFRDLRSFLDPTLTIKVCGPKHPKGKTYVAPEPSVALGLRCVVIMSDPDTELTASVEDELYAELLGPAWAEMNADRVPYSAMIAAGRATMIRWASDVDQAQTYASGVMGDPKARATLPTRRPGSISRLRERTARATRVAVRGSKS